MALNIRDTSMKRTCLFFCVLLLVGCATTSVDLIREVPPGDPQLQEVRANLEKFTGREVRWGGSIAGVENRANETWIEIVARPLDSYGRPQSGDESLGRFIAEVKGFRDPAVYAQGRLITVAGTVRSALTRSIGQYPYTYVIVDAKVIKLWEQPNPQSYYPYRYYDPWYDPFWPMRPFPWYAPYPYWW